MTIKEWRQINQQQLGIFQGILFHDQEFAPGPEEIIQYRMDCPEYETLREKYRLEEIAGKGTDFQRAKRLLHYLAPRLTHSSWYDNHVPCNALDLLEYSLDNPEQGINCLNKSKILQECCQAVGIYARRMVIMPYSPYDFDNHVVTEVYDWKLRKWIMLDPTTDGYFVDREKNPLSLLEMRQLFALGKFVTYVKSTDKLGKLESFPEKYVYQNAYICKNLYYFGTEPLSAFGEGDRRIWCCPRDFSPKGNTIANMRYRMDNLPEHMESLREDMDWKLKTWEEREEACIVSVKTLLAPPIKY